MRLPWRRPPAPSISREAARDLVDHPPDLPDPFEYGTGPQDRFIASTRQNEPTDMWGKTFAPEQYPAPELFTMLEQLDAWQDVLGIDLAICASARDDNVSLLSGFATGLVLALPASMVEMLAGDHQKGIVLFASTVLVGIGGLVSIKVPYRRLDRLRLIQVAYSRRHRELETPEGVSQ